MGVKRPGREVDHLVPSWRGAQLKKAQGQLYFLTYLLTYLNIRARFQYHHEMNILCPVQILEMETHHIFLKFSNYTRLKFKYTNSDALTLLTHLFCEMI
jgi:hypothetical protein